MSLTLSILLPLPQPPLWLRVQLYGVHVPNVSPDFPHSSGATGKLPFVEALPPLGAYGHQPVALLGDEGSFGA